MRPTLRPGDRLVVRHGAAVAPGRLVVARFADDTLTIKRAVRRSATGSGAPGWWVLSDNASAGVDSRHRGPVPDSSTVAVAVARIWPWPRLLRSGGHG